MLTPITLSDTRTHDGPSTRPGSDGGRGTVRELLWVVPPFSWRRKTTNLRITKLVVEPTIMETSFAALSAISGERPS